MKKTFLVGTLAAALLLTGCGKEDNVERRLVCSQKVSIVDVDMIADFKGDNLEYLGLKYSMGLDSYNDAQISAVSSQDMCSTVKTAMSGYSEAFTNCKQSLEGKTLVITADFDLDKMAGTDLSKKTSVEEATKALESQNYTCKVTNK